MVPQIIITNDEQRSASWNSCICHCMCLSLYLYFHRPCLPHIIFRIPLVLGGTGCQCDMLSENIWFTWSKPSYYSIFGKEKSVDGVEKKSIEKEMQKTKKVSRCWWVGGGGTPNRTSGQTSRPPPVTSHSPNKFWQYLKNRIYESLCTR